MTERITEAVAKVQTQLALQQELLGLLKPKRQDATEAIADAMFYLRAAARSLADVGKPDE